MRALYPWTGVKLYSRNIIRVASLQNIIPQIHPPVPLAGHLVKYPELRHSPWRRPESPQEIPLVSIYWGLEIPRLETCSQSPSSSKAGRAASQGWAEGCHRSTRANREGGSQAQSEEGDALFACLQRCFIHEPQFGFPQKHLFIPGLQKKELRHRKIN